MTLMASLLPQVEYRTNAAGHGIIMNLSEVSIVAIFTAVITYVLAPTVNRLLSRKVDQATSQLTLAQAAQMTVSNVLLALEKQEDTNTELRKGIETLEEALNLKNSYIDRLEAEIEETKALKVYVRALIEFLRGKGVDFPPPPDGLLDTDPKIKKARKK